jgi:DNA-binding IscR family transcriptional regulator
MPGYRGGYIAARHTGRISAVAVIRASRIATIVTIDNGPEFACKVLDAWAYANGLKLNFIEPGKP